MFENFPYTNFHELNLDWILERMKTLGKDMTTLKNYVDNYFDNINLPDIVEQKAAEIEDLSFFKNKKICIIGDSISDNTTNPPNWTVHFTETVKKVGAIVTNIAENGASFASWNQNFDSKVPIGQDIYIVFLGVNDFQGQFPFTPGQTYSVYDSVYTFFAKLTDRNKQAEVFYMSPIKYYLATGLKNKSPLSFYRRFYELTASSFGATVISGYNAPKLNTFTQSNILSDYLHPGTGYAPVLAAYIIRAMTGHVSTFSHEPIDYYVDETSGAKVIMDSNTFDIIVEVNTQASLSAGWYTITTLPAIFKSYVQWDLNAPAAYGNSYTTLGIDWTTGTLRAYLSTADESLRFTVHGKLHILNNKIS